MSKPHGQNKAVKGPTAGPAHRLDCWVLSFINSLASHEINELYLRIGQVGLLLLFTARLSRPRVSTRHKVSGGRRLQIPPRSPSSASDQQPAQRTLQSLPITLLAQTTPAGKRGAVSAEAVGLIPSRVAVPWQAAP